MEEGIPQLATPDVYDLDAELVEDELIAGKKKGGDEDGIIAVLQG